MFAHLQRLPIAYFDRNPVGRLVTRMTTDADVINEMFAAGALTIAMDGLTLLGIVAILFHLHVKLALVTLSLMPLMALAINFFRVRARQSYRLIRERIARINAFLQEHISGMAIVQLFVREARTFREFDQLNDAHREANHLSNMYEAALFSLVEAVSSISIALTVWYASGRIVAGAIAFGTLVAFVEYIQKFFIPIRDFSTKYAVMQSAMAAAERVFQLLDTPAPGDASRRYAPAQVAGRVDFDSVWFSYKRPKDGGDRAGRLGAARRVVLRRAGGDGGDRRRHRVREDDARSSSSPASMTCSGEPCESTASTSVSGSSSGCAVASGSCSRT